jgi:hypothetical protein
LQETRDLDIIMHINQRSIAQKNLTRLVDAKTNKFKGLNEENWTYM